MRSSYLLLPSGCHLSASLSSTDDNLIHLSNRSLTRDPGRPKAPLHYQSGELYQVPPQLSAWCIGLAQRRVRPGRKLSGRGHRVRHRHLVRPFVEGRDRKSTRLNSSHLVISYAVFCLKKKYYNG